MSRRSGCAALGALLLALAVASPAGAQSANQRVQAAQANTQLAITYLKQNNLQAAREKIDKALKQNPRTADTQMVAGFVYDRLGEDRKARDHFEQAVRLGGKDNPDVLNNAGSYFCRKGEMKLGESYFVQAAASPLYRTPEVAYTNAGRCARADGRASDAEGYFRQALAIRPDMPDALLQMADLQHEAGRSLPARAFLQRYSAVAPASSGSLWLGYRIETSLGDRAAAGEYARRLKSDFPMAAETVKLLEAEQAAK